MTDSDKKQIAAAQQMMALIEDAAADMGRQGHAEPLAKAVALNVTANQAFLADEIRKLRADVTALLDILSETEND